jgi:membrane protease YdiL (CAAX protease family)
MIAKDNRGTPNIFSAFTIFIVATVFWLAVPVFKRMFVSFFPAYVFEVAGILSNIAIILFLFLVLIIGKYNLGRTLRISRLKVRFFLPAFLMISGVIMLTIVIEWLLYQVGIIKWSITIVPFIYHRSSLLLLFGSMNMIIFAPMMQELLLRGLLQSSLLVRVKPWLAISIPSILFCLVIMVIQPSIIILVTFISYGIMVYMTGSIVPGILMHSVYNAWLIAYNLLSNRGIIPRILEVNIISVFIIILLGVSFISWSNVLCNRKRKEY